jgi:hypothetical protein
MRYEQRLSDGSHAVWTDSRGSPDGGLVSQDIYTASFTP